MAGTLLGQGDINGELAGLLINIDLDPLAYWPPRGGTSARGGDGGLNRIGEEGPAPGD